MLDQPVGEGAGGVGLARAGGHLDEGTRLSVAEELDVVVSANLQRAVRLRQSILQRAFTGALVA